MEVWDKSPKHMPESVSEKCQTNQNQVTHKISHEGLV